jgi:hypothetical protein
MLRGAEECPLVEMIAFEHETVETVHAPFGVDNPDGVVGVVIVL